MVEDIGLIPEIVLATGNHSKLVQVRAILEPEFIVNSPQEVEVKGEFPEEGDDLQVNASMKAAFVKRQKTDFIAIADDTGLFIDALGGRPGARSARWAGNGATTDEITAFTLKQLEGVNDRAATFKTVVAAISKRGNAIWFYGEVRGQILSEPRTAAQPGMPYSPIFVPDGYDKVWAEMTTEEENAISHRGIAFKEAKRFILSCPSMFL